MSETAGDYKVGHGKPPLGSRFKKGQSGNPGGRLAKSAKGGPPLMVRKFDEQVVVATNGRRQKTTRRETIVIQLIDEPAGAGTKILSDLLKEVEKKVGAWLRPVEIA